MGIEQLNHGWCWASKADRATIKMYRLFQDAQITTQENPAKLNQRFKMQPTYIAKAGMQDRGEASFGDKVQL